MTALLGLLFVLPPSAAVATAYLAFTLGLITLSDARHFIIPDVLSLPAIPAGMVASVLVLHGGDWQSGLRESLFGIIAGGGTFYLLRWLYFRWRGVEGLGLGDVKLAAVRFTVSSSLRLIVTAPSVGASLAGASTIVTGFTAPSAPHSAARISSSVCPPALTPSRCGT